jgi:hypothetical protein
MSGCMRWSCNSHTGFLRQIDVIGRHGLPRHGVLRPWSSRVRFYIRWCQAIRSQRAGLRQQRLATASARHGAPGSLRRGALLRSRRTAQEAARVDRRSRGSAWARESTRPGTSDPVKTRRSISRAGSSRPASRGPGGIPTAPKAPMPSPSPGPSPTPCPRLFLRLRSRLHESPERLATGLHGHRDNLDGHCRIFRIVIEGLVRSPQLGPGERWPFTFTRSGFYDLHIEEHPGVDGLVVVR